MLPRRGALDLLRAFDFADTCIQFFKASENGIVEMNDRTCVIEVQFRELLVQTLDGWVLDVGLLVLHGFEVSLEVFETLVDAVDVDFVHGWFFGWFNRAVIGNEMEVKCYRLLGQQLFSVFYVGPIKEVIVT